MLTVIRVSLVQTGAGLVTARISGLVPPCRVQVVSLAEMGLSGRGLWVNSLCIPFAMRFIGETDLPDLLQAVCKSAVLHQRNEGPGGELFALGRGRCRSVGELWSMVNMASRIQTEEGTVVQQMVIQDVLIM